MLLLLLMMTMNTILIIVVVRRRRLLHIEYTTTCSTSSVQNYIFSIFISVLGIIIISLVFCNCSNDNTSSTNATTIVINGELLLELLQHQQ